MRIVLIRERKLPADSRVAFSPAQVAEINKKHPSIEMVVESSPDRVFSDEQYLNKGVSIVNDITDCDILIGIKEVPKDALIANKTYMFFSHTIKMQPYNQALLQTIVKKNIKLIDYECLSWPKGGRILGFGHWAGVVGAYNAFLTWGEKYGEFNLKPAYKCANYEEVKAELQKVKSPNINIAFTGNGRVANGIREILEFLRLKELCPIEFLEKEHEDIVFTQLGNFDLYKREGNNEWSKPHFYKNHTEYKSIFNPYIAKTDMLINGMYWEDDLPPLFDKADTARPNFRIKVIADITCDVEGSVPITLEATPINNPTMGWDASTQKRVDPHMPKTIDVMAVTNLPTELPADASEDFGKAMMKHIIPLFGNDLESILENATLTSNGKLTNKYSYLQDYLDGK